MKLDVNGAPRELPEGTTVSALLAALGVRAEGVAVAVDRHIVPRSQFSQRKLTNGARVEILRAVGGG